MSVVMLFIAREDSDSASFHEDETAALSALIQYVDKHWTDAKLPDVARDFDAESRVAIWFKATGALYVIGEASIADETP